MSAEEPTRHGMTEAEFTEWVAQLRADQGLPPHVENPTTLQHVADLFIAAGA